jgi:outer membrane protein assembly factor BamB
MKHVKFPMPNRLLVKFLLKLVIPAIILLESEIIAQPVFSQWPMFRRDNFHTGRQLSYGPENPYLSWKFSARISTSVSAVIGPDGTLYIGSNSVPDTLYAINPDGTLKWFYISGKGSINSSAAVDANRIIYFVSGTVLNALNPNGTLRWSRSFVNEFGTSTSVTIGPDGTIFVNLTLPGGGYLHAVNPDSSLKWDYPSGGDAAEPAFAPDGTIYLSSPEGVFSGALGTLRAIDSDGSPQWMFMMNSYSGSAPAIGVDGTIYVGSGEGVLYAVNPDSTLKWLFEIGGAIRSSPGIGANGTIYFGSDDNNVYAVNPDGSLRWSFPTAGAVSSSPAIDGSGTIYIGSDDGYLYVINPDGMLKWKYYTSRWGRTSPAISDDGTVYVLNIEPQIESADGVLALSSFAENLEVYRGEPSSLQDLNIGIVPPADFQFSSGTINFRMGGETIYQRLPLIQTGDSLLATIPADRVTLRGIEYYLILSDTSRLFTYPDRLPQQYPVYIPVREASVDYPLTFQPQTYQMISLPLITTHPGIEEVLGDNYGKYDPKTWRILRWRDNSYQEFPGLEDVLEPGKAFWLITREGQVFDIDSVESINPQEYYRLTIDPGWNQIGNPFPFSVSWDSIGVVLPFQKRARSLQTLQPPVYFNGMEYEYNIKTLRPWEGYFVYNSDVVPYSVSIPPVESGDTLGLAGNRLPFDFTDGYSVQIIASIPGSRFKDSQNYIGLSDEASAAKRPLNFREAPSPGDNICLSIIDDKQRYAGNFKPIAGEGQYWDVDLTAPESFKSLMVELKEYGRLPESASLYVFDRDENRFIILSNLTFPVRVSHEFPVRHLRILIGTSRFARENAAAEVLLPENYYLAQNFPNPFNSGTMILYCLAHTEKVTLRIYDVLGRQVRTLVNEEQERGLHRILWDGKGEKGIELTSGIYIYRIKTPHYNNNRKVLLIK